MDRSASIPLRGKTLPSFADVFIFVPDLAPPTVSAEIDHLHFLIDGVFFRREGSAPWDYNGAVQGSAGLDANPVNIGSLGAGLHEITAQYFTSVDDSVIALEVATTFTVVDVSRR
jgi:hypothetical protein